MGDLLVTAASTIKVADAAITFSKNHKITRNIKRLFLGTKDIILTGCSGTGKTQFFLSLDNTNRKYLRGTDKTYSVSSEKKEFQDHFLEIWDTPGHKASKSKKMELFTSMIQRDKKVGIINVVCYGYHFVDGIKKDDIGNTAKFNDFIKANREEEINQLSQLKVLTELNRVKWVITLVTKADLWHSEDEDIIFDYYRNGDYSKQLDNTIVHCVVPYCSVLKNYYDTIKPGIDETEKYELNQSFKSVLYEQLKAWS